MDEDKILELAKSVYSLLDSEGMDCNEAEVALRIARELFDLKAAKIRKNG